MILRSLSSVLKILTIALLVTFQATGFELPAKSSQCLVGVAEGWNSSKVTLRLYGKSAGKWQPTSAPWSGRLGKNGLVWGTGIHPLPAGVTTKKEGDNRSPAGVFAIGGAWGYAAKIKKHNSLAYRTVTKRDLWVEDPASPHYNRHLILDHDPTTAWEKQQQMKQADAAHALKLFIGHNAPPRIVAGAGSSIFFHIWRRDGASPTAGCTTMERARLEALVAQMDPARFPIYVLLTRTDYENFRAQWQLP